MIVMWHKFIYELKGKQNELHSFMVVEGEDSTYTAMSKTVGLPVAICTRLILNEKITKRGVLIPIDEEVYNPILNELAQYGISFEEEEVSH